MSGLRKLAKLRWWMLGIGDRFLFIENHIVIDSVNIQVLLQASLHLKNVIIKSLLLS
jgi:hypothetical protein